ncbi:gamma-glutamylcyclotransferase family protein [Verminephrobacter eiseniae]|uniref:gamma-glutamylcyclotransferase family protein n=1 Tax=Verminephrobacter eiseniae TaxID=364317 RepID=UPI0022386357|nr:gamma-glutamylcyclotransferase family protein [Verminephrobacter eiseniae]MCW5237594.1 gamma-glutamylcyclotransferase [Verminephrobacter eiseniae]
MSDHPAPARPPRRVCVCGTLRRGGSNDITRLRPAARFIGPARLAGRRYHLGGYPGIALGGAQWVQGKVYAIDAEPDAVLDDIEGPGADPGGEYLQRDVLVQVSGQALPRLVCEINPRRLVSDCIPEPSVQFFGFAFTNDLEME